LQGAWVHPEIDNPEYVQDDEIYRRNEICGLGFDLWQVKAGTIFDNVLITDDAAHARQVGEDVWRPTFEAEKAAKDKADEEERKKREDEAKTEKDDDDDEDEDDEEEQPEPQDLSKDDDDVRKIIFGFSS